MFAALAHDLRTPLTIIQGHVEGLEQMNGESYEAKRSQYLQVIKRNTTRASKLLQDMNTIAEIEKVSFRLQPLPWILKNWQMIKPWNMPLYAQQAHNLPYRDQR